MEIVQRKMSGMGAGKSVEGIDAGSGGCRGEGP